MRSITSSLPGNTGCAVATTAESGGDEVVAYLNHVLNYLGAISVGGMALLPGNRKRSMPQNLPHELSGRNSQTRSGTDIPIRRRRRS